MVSIKHLKKGDVLVKEGDMSNSMYWLQSGALRLFKKKGAGFIEIGVVHSGEVVGEMSFLDNQARSASVEALQPCDIVEIPRGKFDEFIESQPSWMKSLIQTLVKRLRTTNNRLRELENASTVYAKDEDGRTTRVHEFLSTAEILKLCSALLLVFARNSEKSSDGQTKVKAGFLQLFGAQIFNVQLAKIQVFIDTLQDAKVLKVDKQKDHVDLYLEDPNRIEKFIYWLHEENLKVHDKQIPITGKGVAILEAVVNHGAFPTSLAEPDAKHSVNMDDVYQKAAAEKNVKLPFELSCFDEIVQSGLAEEMRADGTAKTAAFHTLRVQKLFPHLFLRQKFRDVNQQKRGEFTG